MPHQSGAGDPALSAAGLADEAGLAQAGSGEAAPPGDTPEPNAPANGACSCLPRSLAAGILET